MASFGDTSKQFAKVFSMENFLSNNLQALLLAYCKDWRQQRPESKDEGNKCKPSTSLLEGRSECSFISKLFPSNVFEVYIELDLTHSADNLLTFHSPSSYSFFLMKARGAYCTQE